MTRAALSGIGRALDRGQRWIRFRLGASWVNPWRVPVLRPRDFAGKRVIIIGPASTVADDLRDVEVDGYDVVVRLNSGFVLAERDPDLLGHRTDILFHNLKERGERSAGAIPAEVLRAHGVATLVFHHWGMKGSKTRLYAKRRELRAAPDIVLKVPSVAFCEDLRRDLDGMQPTVGGSAIAFFLGCDLRELAIHGFTFFATPYAAGYNDAVQSGGEAQAWAMASGVHVPGREKAVIAHRIAEAERRGIDVVLGRNVRRHLEA